MALNIDWRFAGPQDIKVPQSNVLASLDKNIQKGLEIKKEFEKKAYDDDMIQLMTVEAENKLINLNAEKDELIAQYESLSPDEQLAQKTNFENKINELYAEIKLAEKEVIDARMNANQFKTTGTTDFFRWKKDKEYAAETAAVNRDAINAQIKAETLSNTAKEMKEKTDELADEIKLKEAEFNKSNDPDEKRRLWDEANTLKEKHNKLTGKVNYEIVDNAIDIKDKGFILNEIKNLKWAENLDNSDAVKNIRDEISKYSPSVAKDELIQSLRYKINELNDAETAKNKNVKKAVKTKQNDLASLHNNANAVDLLKYYNNQNNNEKDRNTAKGYLIDILSKTPTGTSADKDTPAQAAYTLYDGNVAMRNFINANFAAINSKKQ